MNRRIGALALILLTAACGGDGEAVVPSDVMERETFIATYVDLRRATTGSPDFRLSDDERAQILAQHGTDAESLVRFADAHGRDLEYMNEVWTEVESRLERPGEEVISTR